MNYRDTRTGIVHVMRAEGPTNDASRGLRWSWCMAHHTFSQAMEGTHKAATCLVCLASMDFPVIGLVQNIVFENEKFTWLVFAGAVVQNCVFRHCEIDILAVRDARITIAHNHFVGCRLPAIVVMGDETDE